MNNLVCSIFLFLFIVACGNNCDTYEAVLHNAELQNQNYDSITQIDDLKKAAEYYQRFGSSNEQMRAYYLLASAYRDMGDSPQALDIYSIAADCADTSATDCNFALLARVYGQMAELFEEYAMPRNQLEADRKAYHYAMHAKDTLAALAFFNKYPSSFGRLGDDDSILYYSEESYRRFLHVGDTLSAYKALEPSVIVYLNRGNYRVAKKHIDKLESASKLNENGKFDVKSNYLLFYVKGYYYELTQKFDSAVTFYNRLVQEGEAMNNVSLGYLGLYRLYKKTNNVDSIIKYADVYTKYNGYYVDRLENSGLQKAQALYNYNCYKNLSERASAKASRLGHLLITVVLVVFVSLSFLAFAIYVQRTRIKSRLSQMASSYAVDMLSYQKNYTELVELRKKHGSTTSRITDLETELEILRNSIAKQLDFPENPVDWDAETLLLNSTVVERLHRKAAKGEMATTADWNETRLTCNQLMPNFMKTIASFDYTPNLRETNVCILVKLRFAPAEQSILLGVKETTHIRVRLYEKWHQERGTAAKFDAFILSITN